MALPDSLDIDTETILPLPKSVAESYPEKPDAEKSKRFGIVDLWNIRKSGKKYSIYKRY